jgi:hypothetical protein
MANPAVEYSPTHAKEADAAAALCGACAKPNPLADVTLHQGHTISANAASAPVEGGSGVEADCPACSK